MEKKRIILKTHGLKNSREVGMVILPDSFYVKVHIEENGEFEVEFFNSEEEQLFYLSYAVENKIEKTPTAEELLQTEKEAALFIVNSLAGHLLDNTNDTYNTEAHKTEWAEFIMSAFQ